VRAGSAVFLDNAFRQQIRNRLVLAFRAIHTEGVIEPTIFTDQNDNVLDRGFRLHVISGIVVVLPVIKELLNKLDKAEMTVQVPVASTGLVREGGGYRSQSHCASHTQRGGGAPFLSRFEYQVHFRPQSRLN